MSTVISLLIVLFFVLVNAFFSGTEMAVITLNDAKIHKLSEDGDRKARRVIGFIDNPGRFLATIQVGVTFAGFLSSAFAASNFSSKLAGLLPGSGSWKEPLCTVIITIVLSFFSLVFGELVPKRVAQKYPEKWSYAAAGMVRTFGAIVRPFVAFLTLSTNAVLRLLHIDPNDKDRSVTEDLHGLQLYMGSSEDLQDIQRTCRTNSAGKSG